MAHQFTLQQMKTFCLQFTAVNSVQNLFELLMVDESQYNSICANNVYNCFKIPKRTGGFRLIEEPSEVLKRLQAVLNDYLQSVYYFHGPDSSHGFIASPDNDSRVRRNILTNALAHVHAAYLVNLDLLDFFHYVTEQKVMEIFTSYPFYFSPEMGAYLVPLVTYKNRLPMGAPTSPVLSNFSMVLLDKMLLQYCKEQKIVYTRFVDDLSFSSQTNVGPEIIKNLVKQIEAFGFRINQKKLKHFGPEDKKLVTGVSIHQGTISLDEKYLSILENELMHFSHINRVRMYYRMQEVSVIEKYKCAIRGKLQFVKMVLGADHEDYKKLKKIWNRGNQWKKEDYGYFNWLEYFY